MPFASTWFREVDLGRSPPSVLKQVDEICHLLDRLQPVQLDPDRQTLHVDRGNTWVKLVHASDEVLDLDIALNTRKAHVFALLGHDEALPRRSRSGTSGESPVVSAVARLLRGRYRIRDTYWRGYRVWTSVTDLVGDAGEVFALSSWQGLLPLPRGSLNTDTRTSEYGCLTPDL